MQVHHEGGVGAYLVLNALVGQTFQVYWGQDRFGNLIWVDVQIRNVMQWIGAALFGIGVAHLVVYAVGNPLAMVAGIVLLALSAGLAGYLPARRASGLNPTQVLRYEY